MMEASGIDARWYRGEGLALINDNVLRSQKEQPPELIFEWRGVRFTGGEGETWRNVCRRNNKSPELYRKYIKFDYGIVERKVADLDNFTKIRIREFA